MSAVFFNGLMVIRSQLGCARLAIVLVSMMDSAIRSMASTPCKQEETRMASRNLGLTRPSGLQRSSTILALLVVASVSRVAFAADPALKCELAAEKLLQACI